MELKKNQNDQELKMLAVKAHYKDGVIDILEPIPVVIKEADLNIVVIPRKIVKLKRERDNVFTGEDKKAYEAAMVDYEKGEYIEMEDYIKKRGLSV
ncbi:MAG: hypothetical protein NT166_15705 [Candidatus Aminicenantes bacterium]|nr:hypothetical protein [Candidatus Aminicenantes bacterium]